ncbi:MAG: GAF domain-containing protein [Anaerolineae bacterium]|nr:MAG: GAF domain-containing protein [Anaerolineae bacterium]
MTAKTQTLSLAEKRTQIRLAIYLTAGFQVIAAIAVIAMGVLAFQFRAAPFLGVFVEHTLMVNGIQPIRPGSWNGRAAGLETGDLITAIDGEAVHTPAQLFAALRKHAIGDAVSLTVERETGEVVSRAVTLQAFPWLDFINYMVIPWLIGAAYLACGLWVFSLRYNDSAGRIFSLFAASAALGIAGLLDIHTFNRLTHLWTFSLALAGATIIHLGFVFPRQSRRIKRWPAIAWVSYLLAAGLTLWAWPTLYNTAEPRAYIAAWRAIYIFTGLGFLFFLGVVALRRFTASAPLLRQQARLILYGSLIAFLPISLWFLITAVRPQIRFTTLLILPLIAFPIAITYTILRYRLLDTDILFSRFILYTALSAIAIGGYALLAAGLGLIFFDALHPPPAVMGALFFLLALLLDPLRASLRWLIDRVFFRGQRALQDRLRRFGQELSPTMELGEISGLLRRYIQDSLAPAQIHIFLPDSVSDYFVAEAGEDGEPTSGLRFARNSPLPATLERSKAYIFLGNEKQLPPSLQVERARIALLGAEVFVPLMGRQEQLIGFVALTARRSGEPYSTQDVEYVASLGAQAAIAIERMQVIIDLERRVEAMNALMRLAEGINVTQHFDDTLELIYAQTNRLIPTRDFWILLYDEPRQLYQFAFYLEDDMRLLERESKPVSSEGGLARVVIETARPLITEDYTLECRRHGTLPQTEGLYAWMGVPLIAGSQIIGSLCLGSRDSTVVYTQEQANLLQAVADQAAAAITRARLLEEMRHRARQLSRLNEITRSLTSTLDIRALLNQILDSAMEMLNCEAGTLFLVDENSGELVFEVVGGPVADDLLGQRLPPDTGHAGRAVRTGQPAIVNRAYRTSEWDSQTDEKTGFETRDLLLAPMQVQKKVLGVIELINRRDGAPFTQDDMELLLAFAGQAAVALENARLYTLTDQKLAARVDELSVMQRIDRELNTSLDIQNAMHITLSWAMQRSGADAGLIGMVEDGHLRMMASQGYGNELKPYRDGMLPLDDFLPLRHAVSEANTQIIRRDELNAGEKGNGLLKEGRSFLVYPIRREQRVIGLMLLESRAESAWSEDALGFLSRLSDHAAIAIANAQLFSEVQAANQAKNDFISFVAHELKTPMTSIRGYTDLLLGGAMGELNEGQRNFLQIVRANVSRMATLVSDLSDISRIEAGKLRLDFQAVDLNEVIEETVRSQRHSLDGKQQELIVESPPDLPPVWGDRTRLVQILVNLVSNAHKYSPENARIRIRAAVSDNLWDEDGAPQVVRVDVEDNGIGMTEEDQAKIFSKFFRSENPEARSAPGSGLGLNITKNLVEMQGGKIWFVSEFGKGTTFSFTIPVAQV